MQDQFVTRDEFAARLAEFELRIIDRIAAFERRMDERELHLIDRMAALERRMDEHFRTQTRWIVGLYAAVALAALVLAVR